MKDRLHHKQGPEVLPDLIAPAQPAQGTTPTLDPMSAPGAISPCTRDTEAHAPLPTALPWSGPHPSLASACPHPQGAGPCYSSTKSIEAQAYCTE